MLFHSSIIISKSKPRRTSNKTNHATICTVICNAISSVFSRTYVCLGDRWQQLEFAFNANYGNNGFNVAMKAPIQIVIWWDMLHYNFGHISNRAADKFIQWCKLCDSCINVYISVRVEMILYFWFHQNNLVHERLYLLKYWQSSVVSPLFILIRAIIMEVFSILWC